MIDKTLLALYGLIYNPFLPALPPEARWSLPGAESFVRRLETLVPHGGFVLLTGEPGYGKSKTLQWIAKRLGQLPDLTVGVIERPQSRTADFYRELGDLFGVSLNPSNRYGGFKALRIRWQAHCEATLQRPVLLIDEAQEMSSDCLTELRLLQSGPLRFPKSLVHRAMRRYKAPRPVQNSGTPASGEQNHCPSRPDTTFT